MENEVDHNNSLEDMMKKIGDFGRYQCFQFMLHIVAAITAGMHLLALLTIAAVPEHRCTIIGVDSPNYTEPWNSSLVLEAIPLNEFGKLDSCHVYGENRTLNECQSWVYDTQYYTSSRGIEWNFVCSRQWMGAAPQTSVKCGAILGSLVLGRLSDKYGRKTIFLLSAVLQLVFSTVVAFTTEYYTFLTIRFLCGIFGISAFKAGFVLTIELIGPSKRTIFGSLFEVGYGTGVMLLAAWGYIIDNRFYLQIVYALHAVLLLPHWFLMDESPRWLWAQGRYREAATIVQKAIKINKSSESVHITLLDNSYKNSNLNHKIASQAGTFDLFKTPNLLKRTLIICGCWFSNSVVYFGLTLSSGKLNGNPYLIIFLIGFVEFPGFMVAMYFVHKVGHRTLISTMMFLSGTCCLVVVFMDPDSIAVIGVVLLGKLIVSGTFSIVIKYSAELFPTVARSSGVGLATMCSSLSGALTPLVTLLDAVYPNIHALVFGLVALSSGLSILLLPETLGRRLPQTLEDGEKFGIGDNCFASCRGRKSSGSSTSS